MKPNTKFLKQSMSFWADIKIISEQAGYSSHGVITVPETKDVITAYTKVDLKYEHLFKNSQFTEYGNVVNEYFCYRARSLNEIVEKMLMSREEAEAEFTKLHNKKTHNCPIPLNKQSGDKKAPAYFTSIINMLIDESINGLICDYDPRRLTIITDYGTPMRVLSRRVDGAFPSPVNPISIWEIKEYYYTTTFGSRVADGVYETLVDGMELEELEKYTNIKVFHYLMIDDRNTWWNMGKSYLCRIFDMLHMGYVDEVLFGREVFDRIPQLVSEWVEVYENRK